MPASPSHALEVLQRRKKVAALYLQGRYQWEIGQAVGVDRGTISRDLKAIRDQWQGAALADWTQAKNRELDRVDLLERTYWESWERSMAPAESSTQEKLNGTGGERMKAAIRREGRDGNPAFLAGVQWCIERRCKLLGLDAPQRVSLNARDIDHEITALMANLGLAGAPAPLAPPAADDGRDAPGPP
jgi:hypothetical protein